MTTVHQLECAIIRGGTTKGIFLDARQLPENENLRDAILLSLFGSPDTRQINGLGGADPLTSKVALITPSDHPDADVDYRSGEVGIDEASINYSTMCGNLAAGAALFAHEFELKKDAQASEVKIRNLNTGKFLIAKLPLKGNQPQYTKAGTVDGVQGFGIRVELSFSYPAGAISGQLLPSGKAIDRLSTSSGELDISIVDCGTLYGFVRASDLQLSGQETPEQIDHNLQVRKVIEELRNGIAGLISKTVGKPFEAKQIKLAIVNTCKDESADLSACVINTYKTHKAYPVTGAICVSAASRIANSIVYVLARKHVASENSSLTIKHPSGLIETQSSVLTDDKGKLEVTSAGIARTAHLLVRGSAQVLLE